MISTSSNNQEVSIQPTRIIINNFHGANILRMRAQWRNKTSGLKHSLSQGHHHLNECRPTEKVGWIAEIKEVAFQVAAKCNNVSADLILLR